MICLADCVQYIIGIELKFSIYFLILVFHAVDGGIYFLSIACLLYLFCWIR